MTKISFVVPAYNEEAVLERCLHSILNELMHTPCQAEIVLVNNASTDRTKEIASSIPGIRVIDEDRKGLVFARKAGFEATTGELVANIDADTILPIGWLAKVFTEFSTHKDIVALSGPFLYHDISPPSRFLVRMFYISGYVSHWLFGMAMLQGGNFVIQREAWESVGGYDTSIAFYGEDTDIARRLSEIGTVKWTFALPAYSSGRRLIGEGIVSTGLHYVTNYFGIIFMGKPFSKEYQDIRM